MRYDKQEVWSQEDKQEHQRLVGELMHNIKSSFEQLKELEEDGVIHQLQDWVEGL